jgi:hypothetical protein
MWDAQGHELTGATTEAIGYFDRGVRAFTLVYGDAAGLYDAARTAAPDFVMAHLAKAWPFALANDPMMAVTARALLNTAGSLAMNNGSARILPPCCTPWKVVGPLRSPSSTGI